MLSNLVRVGVRDNDNSKKRCLETGISLTAMKERKREKNKTAECLLDLSRREQKHEEAEEAEEEEEEKWGKNT